MYSNGKKPSKKDITKLKDELLPFDEFGRPLKRIKDSDPKPTKEKEKYTLPPCVIERTNNIFGVGRIKIPETKVVKHKSPYLLDGHLSIGLIGASGSGKSFLLTTLLPCIDVSQVIILSRLKHLSIYDAIESYCNENGIEFFNETDPAPAYEVIQSAMDTKPADKYGIFIIDDFTAYNSSRTDEYVKVMNLASGMARNLGYYNIFITQNSTNISTLSRTNTNHMACFVMNQRHAKQSMSESFETMTGHSGEVFNQLYKKYVKGITHGFLWWNHKDVYVYSPQTEELKKVNIVEDSSDEDEEDEEDDD